MAVSLHPIQPALVHHARVPSLRFPLVALLLALPAFTDAAQADHYVLTYDASDRSMQVEACLGTAAAAARFTADDDAPAAIGGIRRDSGKGFTQDGTTWIGREWRAGECLHYRAALGRLADKDRRWPGARRDTDVVTNPQDWLLQPDGVASMDVDVRLPADFGISAPWQPLPAVDELRHFRLTRTPVDWLARVAIGRFAEPVIEVDGGVLHVAVLGALPSAQYERLLEWLRQVARTATATYGRMAVPDAQLLVIPVGAQEQAVAFGQSTRGQGNALTLFVDASRPASEFARDWVAAHELSHLLHPYLGDRGSWLSEGLATYYQNVLRARTGLLTPAQAWEKLDEGFAGAAGDTGQEGTLEDVSTDSAKGAHFQRIYWSGAAYWLDVDLRLRHASRNRLGVDDALRHFAGCCLPSARAWTPKAFVAKLDALAGNKVFSTTFDEYRLRRGFPDLKSVYAALGLKRSGTDLKFDDAAVDAPVRTAIMAPYPGSPEKPRVR